jgi:hypothetical protein
MSPLPNQPNDSLIPSQPIPAAAVAFKKRISALMDGQPKDEATVAKAFEGMDDVIDIIAAGLYSLASMLVGEGEQSIRLVEKAIAAAEVSACHEPAVARKSSRRTLIVTALPLLRQRDPDCLTAPQGIEPKGNCIDDDDLRSAGVSSEELENMIAGPDRDRVRNWLESLPATLRIVFVLRAVAGFTTTETAALLLEHGGAEAAGWTPDAVSQCFRQALCSLASQLIHSTAGR